MDPTGLFAGLPIGWRILFTVDLLLIASLFAWMIVLFARSVRWMRASGRGDPPSGPESEFTWVFLVPALNEETVIADSVERLLRVEAERVLIVVIDDGSEDSTGSVLRRFDSHERVHVLTRVSPEARKGKAAALNDAWARLGGQLAGLETRRDRVIVGIVDADGRLEPDVPARVGRHFDDPTVGGVQVMVRIYNRESPLARMQDVEFAVFGYLFQGGRSVWGTAGMGGSGQFNRLSALDAIADGDGPWRDRLTEDQDLGLRLISAGFGSRQEFGCSIGQQGLSNLRALCRQRIRWAQGNLECLSLAGDCIRAPLPLPARIDLLLQMLMPLWQSTVGVGILAAVGLAVTGTAGFIGTLSPGRIAFLYALAFGGVVLGCIARGYMYGRVRGIFAGVLMAQVYAIYSWILWPVLVGSITRHLRGRNDWSKTEREPVDATG